MAKHWTLSLEKTPASSLSKDGIGQTIMIGDAVYTTYWCKVYEEIHFDFTGYEIGANISDGVLTDDIDGYAPQKPPAFLGGKNYVVVADKDGIPDMTDPSTMFKVVTGEFKANTDYWLAVMIGGEGRDITGDIVVEAYGLDDYFLDSPDCVDKYWFGEGEAEFAFFKLKPLECKHKWDSGTVTIQPTCKAEGVKTYKCTVCSVTKTEAVAKKGHAYSSSYTVDKKATATADGSKAKHCTRCSAKTSVTSIYKASGAKLSTTSYTYDGKTKSPKIYVKDSKGKTISSRNYTISTPSGRKNVGQYTYKITFKNEYSGTKSLTLKINPKGTSISKLSKAKKAFTVKWKKQSGKMKTSRISGYQIQYSTSKKFTNAKTKSVSGYSKTSQKISKLKAKKTYYVRIRTYKTVKVNGKSVKLYSGWSKVKSVKTK